jgi:hypothetical protein
VSLIDRLVDERFLTHRQRSTSVAGIGAALLATLLFAYQYFIDRMWSWELLAVVMTFVAVKLTLMTWYYLTD